MANEFDEHYLKSVTALGDASKVVTSQAIFATNGMKLVDSGVVFNSNFYERLIRHKLLPPIDQCLAVENGVTKDQLRDYAKNLLDEDHSPCFDGFRSEPDTCEKMLRAIQSVTLNAPMTFKLTVARDQRNEIFDHSVRLALISLYLAIKNGLSDRELVNIASASLFHDLGLLHVDPSLLATGHKLEKHERHHLYTHPVTAYLILREYPEYHPEVSTPVYEHHERLDGSGYPQGLKGNEISLSSQILMLAEIASAPIKDGEQKNAVRLSVRLKLNPHKFNRTLSNQLIALISRAKSDQIKQIPEKLAQKHASTPLQALMNTLSEAFKDWNDTFLKSATKPASPGQASLLDLINDRIKNLRKNLQATGFDPDSPMASLVQFANDPEILEELEFTAREAIWQLNDIFHEATRQTESLNRDGSSAPLEIQQWLLRTEAALKVD